MGKEVGARQPDDDEGSITSGSPGNLVLVAVVVALLFFAGLLFYIAARFADSDAPRDNWRIAETILVYIGGGIFSAGLLVGLGTVATARSKGASSRATAVASLVSKAGAAVIILGVAEAVCIIGADQLRAGVAVRGEPGRFPGREQRLRGRSARRSGAHMSAPGETR